MSRAARKFRRNQMGVATGAGPSVLSFHVGLDGRATYSLIPEKQFIDELESGESEILDFNELCEGRMTPRRDFDLASVRRASLADFGVTLKDLEDAKN